MTRKTDVEVRERFRQELSGGYHITFEIVDWYLTGWFGGERRGVRATLWYELDEYPRIIDESWCGWNRDSEKSVHEWELQFECLTKELCEERNLRVLDEVEREYGPANVSIVGDEQ